MKDDLLLLLRIFPSILRTVADKMLRKSHNESLLHAELIDEMQFIILIIIHYVSLIIALMWFNSNLCQSNVFIGLTFNCFYLR